jgi:hypothetical protein
LRICDLRYTIYAMYLQQWVVLIGASFYEKPEGGSVTRSELLNQEICRITPDLLVIRMLLRVTDPRSKND